MLLEGVRASGGNLEQLGRLSMATMESFMEGKMSDVVNAPTADLLALNDRLLTVYTSLSATNPRACGALATGSSLGRVELTPEESRRVDEITVAFLDAGGAGSRRPRQSGRGDLGVEAAEAWLAALEAVDPGGEISAVIEDEDAFAEAPPALQCAAGIAIHAAVRRLPAHLAGEVLSFIFAQDESVVPLPEASVS